MPNIVIIAALFCVFVVALSAVYVWLHRREQKLLRELDETKRLASDGAFLEKRLKEIQARALDHEKKILDEAESQANQVVDQAQEEAKKMVSQAQEQASRSLTEAKQHTTTLATGAEVQAKQLVEEAAQAMRAAEEKFQQEAQSKLTPVYDQAANDVASATSTLNQKTQDLFARLEAEMLTQIKSRQQELDSKMNEEWSQARTEIQEYKTQKQKEIDEWKANSEAELEKTILNLISDTLKETIHVTLTPKEHQQLVFEALERAKESHAFDAPAAE